MNRREFCQTTALFLAGSMCAGTSLRSEEQKTRFRAQKVFLESWDAENVREKVACVRRSDCNALILVPGSLVLSERTQKIASEADRLGLKTFVPARLSRDCFRKVRTPIPLSHETGVLQTIDGRPTDNGGFLLLDGVANLLGLVLYDSSRCLWTGFAPYRIGVVQNSEYNANDSRLVVARWLDYAFASQEPQA